MIRSFEMEAPLNKLPVASSSAVGVGSSTSKSIWKNYGSVCLLCLKTKTHNSVKSDATRHNESRFACVKYVALVSKYVKADCELSKSCQKSFAHNNPTAAAAPTEQSVNAKTSQNGGKTKGTTSPSDGDDSVEALNLGEGEVGDHLSFEGHDEAKKFVLCDACRPTAEKFFQQLEEYEHIRRQLEQRICEATKIIETTSSSPPKALQTNSRKGGVLALSSSDKIFDKLSESGGKKDILLDFREEFKKCGENFIKKPQPQVELKRKVVTEQLEQASPKKLCNAKEEPENPTESLLSLPKSILESQSSPPFKPPIFSLRCPESQAMESEEVKDAMKTYLKYLKSDIKQEENLVYSFILIKILGGEHKGKYTLAPKIKPKPTEIPPPPTLPQPQQPPVISNNPSPSPIQLQSPEVAIETLQCNINACGKTFTKTEQGLWCLHSHFANEHSGLPCSNCSYVSKSPRDLIKHELTHSLFPNQHRPLYGFSCIRCTNWFPFLSDYQEHFFQVHLNTKVDMYKCMQCRKEFSHLKLDLWKEHMTSAHDISLMDNNRTSCPFCKVVFKGPKAVFNHLRFDHALNEKKGLYSCRNPDCGRAFFSNDLLMLHSRICKSLVNEGYACPVKTCGLLHSNLKSLETHLSHLHSNYSPQACPICHLTFYTKKMFNNHLLTHNGEMVRYEDGQVYTVNLQEIAPSSGTGNTSVVREDQTAEETTPVIISVVGTGTDAYTGLSSSTPLPILVDSNMEELGCNLESTQTETEFHFVDVDPSDLFIDEGSDEESAGEDISNQQQYCFYGGGFQA